MEADRPTPQIVQELEELAQESYRKGEFACAMRIRDNLERTCRESGLIPELVASVTTHAVLCFSAGNAARAFRLLDDAEAAVRRTDDRKALVQLLLAKAAMLSVSPKFFDTYPLYAEAEHLCRQIGDAQSLVTALRGKVESASGCEVPAICREAEQLCRQLGRARDLIAILRRRAWVSESNKQWSEAADAYAQVAQLYQRMGKEEVARLMQQHSAKSFSLYAAELQDSNPTLAVSAWADYEQLCRAVGNDLGVAAALEKRAELLVRLGHPEEALGITVQMQDLFAQRGDHEGVARSICKRATFLAENGRLVEAIALLEHQVGIAESRGEVRLERTYLSELAQKLESAGFTDRAVAARTRASALEPKREFFENEPSWSRESLHARDIHYSVAYDSVGYAISRASRAASDHYRTLLGKLAKIVGWPTHSAGPAKGSNAEPDDESYTPTPLPRVPFSRQRSRDEVVGNIPDDRVVECTVFAPEAVLRGENFMVQVFAHLPEQADEAQRHAVEFDNGALRRGVSTLAMQIARKSKLRFHIYMPGLLIGQAVKELVWWGLKPQSVQFGVTVPADCVVGDITATVIIDCDTVPVGHIKFKLTVQNAAPSKDDLCTRCGTEMIRCGVRLQCMNCGHHETRKGGNQVPKGDAARRYSNAFVSYASCDRAEVLKRVQMLVHLHISFFQDVLSLDPGERWQKALYRHIDDSDLFLLFWSRAARDSEWVLKEVHYALDRKAGDDEAPPEILPVIIEGPPPVPPPPELAHLHFDDRVLYFMPHPRT